MKTISFVTLILLFMPVNMIFSQHNDPEKKESSDQDEMAKHTLITNKKTNSTNHLAFIELNTPSTLNTSSNAEVTIQTNNTNIILTEESKGKVLRTTLDFF